uniref:Radical SAM core domain-containing protein n=1 Tax=Glossina austeni TaxID=7395 RepID=A0A1A9UKE7_GLOAU
MNNKKKWNVTNAKKIFNQPFFDLMFKAQKIHRNNFLSNYIQVSALLSIKTGLCPEDCKYCPQSAKYNTGLSNEKLIKLEKVINAAKKAKKIGATRFCMGAAWKNPKDRDMPVLESMIKHVKNLGLETCMTLGMLNDNQVNRLAHAGLDFYNHNLDTSPEYYKNVVTTRSYNDRLSTINKVRNSGIKVCSGGILGLGETINDRISLLVQLSNLSKHPESVPINMLVKIKDLEGLGSGGSGHITGYHPLHKKLEIWLSNWLKFPRALLFSSGFAANQAIINVLSRIFKYIFVDRLSHASILEASINKNILFKRFQHNDIHHLSQLLEKKESRSNSLIFTEGVFSMDGDQVDLKKLITLSKLNNNYLVLDDAHGFGILGDEGKGTSYIKNIFPNLLVVTFSKAVGVCGAAILCQENVAEYFLQYSKNLIYSTSMMPAQAGTILVALKKMKCSQYLRDRLFQNIKRFQISAKKLKLYKYSNTAIHPIIIGDSLLTIKFSQKLQEKGFWVNPILPPSVPVGKGRIRITITAMHRESDIDNLIEALFYAEKNI